MISQTGRVGAHIDLAACTERGIAVAEGVGSPVAPAELTWALIMAAMRRLPQYIGNLKHGAWQQSGLKRLHAAQLRPRQRAARAHPGHLGLRAHRPDRGRLRARLRHERDGLGLARIAARARRRPPRRPRAPSSSPCPTCSRCTCA
jgi:hypothetical protein